MLDERAKLLLKALVERYISDGQPVGSRTLSRASGLELSPATIRNVMSDLEEMGLIVSPHTSAGRIPTARGYRLFVDTMLTVQNSGLIAPELPAEQPQKVIANAAQLLSNMSQFVGVVMAPRRSSVFKHLEFVKLSERRVLVIIVSPQGDDVRAAGAGHHRLPARRCTEPRDIYRCGVLVDAVAGSVELHQCALCRA